MVFVCLVDEGMSYNYGVQMFVCSSVLISVTVHESKTILVPVFLVLCALCCFCHINNQVMNQDQRVTKNVQCNVTGSSSHE